MALVTSLAKRLDRFRLGACTTTRGVATDSLPSHHVQAPELLFDYDELEPVMPAEMLYIHHGKLHKAIVANYNMLMDEFVEAQQNQNLTKICNLTPSIRFFSGGHINHSIFWTNLAPPTKGGGGAPQGDLRRAIEQEFGSFENFKGVVSSKTAAIQGSGWGWVGYDQHNKRLAFATTPDQVPCISTGLVPLLGLDVWEHAYYLKYKNLRPNYLTAMWDIVNWQNVAERFKDAQK